MLILREVSWLRAFTEDSHDKGHRLALVPTMGALHEGHMSLVTLARQVAQRVVVSIFVNPTQFAAHEDLSRYPRDEGGDIEKLKACGADAVFLPDVHTMYPPSFQTRIEPGALAHHLCGASRPGHFSGVCTVVAMLLRMSRCDAAVFGEKDFQQLQVIRRMVQDLYLDVKIIPAPIARDNDGLAKSSRNQNLSPQERAQAPKLNAALHAIAQAIGEGERQVHRALNAGRAVLAQASLASIDYLALAHANVLTPLDEGAVIDDPNTLRIFGAVRFPNARLIDNIPAV